MPSLPQWAPHLALRTLGGRLAYSDNGCRFMVTKPIDGKPATTLNGGTIGFLMSDVKQAEAWHNAGVGVAARRSKIRPACALTALISLIFVTPMAISSSGLLGKLPDLIRTAKN